MAKDTGTQMSFREIAAMPGMQVFVSPACNLRCPYCSNWASREHGGTPSAAPDENVLRDPAFLDLVERIPPTHFYLSGGEPLIHPGIKEFVAIAGERGHQLSFDTNICLPLDRLTVLLDACDPAHVGFINISHHILAGVSFEFIGKRVALLRERGLRHFVKYVGAPEVLEGLRSTMLRWRDLGTGAAATILYGNWDNRRLPRDYTDEERRLLLECVTLGIHGLQLFDGIRARGIPCRGGQDFIAYNMAGEMETTPCCHGGTFRTAVENTFFSTGCRDPVPCPIDICLGDYMFIFGTNSVRDEIVRFERLCHGTFEFLGVEGVLDFVLEIEGRGYELANAGLFEQSLAEVYGCSRRTEGRDLASAREGG